MYLAPTLKKCYGHKLLTSLLDISISAVLFATLAGDGSSDGGGEGEAVAGGNTEEEAEAGWKKLDICWIKSDVVCSCCQI